MTSIKIHPIQTGHVRIKAAQQRRKWGGLPGILLSNTWTPWLPIYAWAIEHPEGVIVVDTGDTARTAEPGYFPRWHPYYRTSVQLEITPEQEVGPQLRGLGIAPEEVRTVILTHFHTDHAGGLSHFPKSDILVSKRDYKNAQGFTGQVQGYLPHRWPKWFAPTPIPFEQASVGPFEQSYEVTAAGDVLIIPTPGHTPGHVSVIVKAYALTYFLAGDTSYNQALLFAQEPDGVSLNTDTMLGTVDKVLTYAGAEPTVYLPSHDPESVERLAQNITLI